MPWWNSRWRTAPEFGNTLTWDITIDGKQVLNSFVTLGCTIQPSDVVLEVGPGYGRIFETFRQHYRFRKWYFVEINLERCKMLEQKFAEDDRVEVLCQDANELELPEKFDLGISTLTFKHLYPDFSDALARIAKFMNDKGSFLFDALPPSDDKRLDEGHSAVINVYSEKSLRNLISLAGFEIVAVSTVHYEGNRIRNLYHLRKSNSPAVESERELRRRIASLERSVTILEDEYSLLLQKSLRPDPLAALLYVYYSRHDLMKAFPEVAQGKYGGLITWAATHGVTTDQAKQILASHSTWYVENSKPPEQ